MNVWHTRSCWASTVWFDVETAADLMGLKPDTIYHYLSRNDPKLPQPTTDRGRLRFSGEQVFRYIVEHRPKAATVVPRLFPRIADLGPARFLGAHRAGLPNVGYFAIHTWQPADAGPLIAIAYPDRENRMTTSDAAKIAVEILKLLPLEIAALAVPNGEAFPRIIGPGEIEDEPTIVVLDRISIEGDVAERNRPYRPHPAGRGTSYYRWADLANLLRVDIPWWSQLVRELDAMLTWQPGAAIAQIAPYAPEVDTGHITALATLKTAPDVRDALKKLANRVLSRLNGGASDDDMRLTPGLIHAAISTIDPAVPTPTLTADEAAVILHHRAHEHMARHALRVADHLAFRPLLTYVMKINRATATSAARQWISRLIDVDPTRRTELGFWYATRYLPSRVRPTRWLTDPDNPHTWIIQGDDANIYAGVGTNTPGAQGKLCGAEIDDEAAFFWDTAHHIWPLPDAGYDYYRTGYHGGGPQRLAETLTTLADDAAADAYTPPTLTSDNSTLYNALYQMVTERHAPLTITAEFIAAAREARPVTDTTMRPL
ncbi:hypothetical protein [Mycobacterium avium]|uniref:Helix-turn-helix domain-containing protein n=1 Tax=Mycobacterium avium subsp. hominissuis TaxID=439334 RepID=A0AAI8X5F5_MYCAV|nr:hypothetical protein [Mycobacterium avium]PBA08478.1 hypothetical protein CKJ70_26070 [Mycobacterium avium]BBN50882.1 hypothetical protein JPH1_53570 [Mycobacterium avium subsp. hominissuis]